MAFSVQYKPLFTVQVLHNYFLNIGAQQFAAMNPAEKQKQLGNYNFTKVFSIAADSNTVSLLNRYRLVFKLTNTGFTVWSKVEDNGVTPAILLDDDSSFTFLLKITDSRFYNFTSLKMENAGKLFFLSNRQPEGFPGFPLLGLSGANLKIGETHLLHSATQTSELKKLASTERNGLFAIVRIHVKAGNPALNLTEASGNLVNQSPVFEIVFDNRKSFWRYIFKNNQVVKPADDVKKEDGNAKILITKAEHPLTQNGFVSIELGTAELPNPGVEKIIPDTASNKYYSEIYM